MIKKLKSYIQSRKDKIAQKWAEMDFDKEEKIEKIKKSRTDRSLKDAKTFLFHMVGTLVLLCLVPIVYILMARAVILEKDALDVVNAEEINISPVAYEDIVNDSNAIVNFNQYVPNTYINYTTAETYSYLTISNISFNIGDKVYIRIYNDSSSTILITFNNIEVIRSTSSQDFIYTCNTNFTTINVYQNGMRYKNFNVINLTQMFGSGNEPNLQEANDLFVADYYAYNTGSAVSLSGLNAYAEGVQSVYDTLTYNYVGEDSYNLLQPYAFYRGSTYYNGAPSKEQSHISVASVDGDGWSSGNGFALYYPFTSSLVAGDTIVLNGMLGSATDLGSHQQATTYIIIRYGENIYDVLSVDNIVLQDATTNNINSFTYTLPSDATGLVFYSVQPFRIKDLTIQIKTLSINNLIDSAYKNGYDKGSNPYQVGNNGYNQIFEAGRLQGVEDAGNYTFLSLLTSAIDVPINSVLHMLDFDLLGMNMKSFYLSMFTFAIIVFVIKLLI